MYKKYRQENTDKRTIYFAPEISLYAGGGKVLAMPEIDRKKIKEFFFPT